MSQRIAPLALLGLAALAACEEKKPQPAPAPTGSTTAAATASAKPKPAIEPTSTSVNPFPALPASFASAANAASDDKIALGKMLYFEARLSKNHDVSCASCHAIDKHGVDGEPTSTGHKKQKGGRNAPTVLNAAGHMAQFWDGRAATIEDQAGGPILNPIEMAMPNEKAVLDTLKSIPGYVDAFKKAFPADKDPITYDNLKKSIGAFERTLATPSRWDKFVAGDASALTDDEKAGFKAFDAAGCPSCHTGTLFGGTMYQEARRGEALPRSQRQRALRRDQAGGRQVRLQGPEPAQRREDGALLPRRLGEDARRGGEAHGRAPARQGAQGRGGHGDRHLPEGPHRRRSQGRQARPAAERPQDAEARSGLTLLARVRPTLEPRATPATSRAP